MSFRDDLRNKLGEEMFNDVVDKLGDDFNYDVVPRTRLNEVIRKRNEYQTQLEELTGGTQHQQGGSNNQQQQQQQKQQPTVEELRKQWESEKDTEITALKVKYAGLDALRAESAVDAELVFSLLDKEKLTFGTDGKLTGLDEQIKSIKESRPYLFTQSQGGRNNTPGGTGKEGGSEKFDAVKSKEDFLKLTYEEQLKFKEAHPQIFQKFLNS